MSTSREQRFAALAVQVSRPVREYVVRRASPDAVDDVLADVSLVLWRRLDDVPEDPLPWCYAVARRQLANHRRAQTRRLRLVERLRAQPAYGPVAEQPDHSAVHAALDRLGELDREVVRLWAWEELAPREIAAVTGLTANAVSIRLHRARKRLAAELATTPDERGDDPEPSRKDPGGPGHRQGEGGDER